LHFPAIGEKFPTALRNYNLQLVVGGAVRQKVTGLAGLSALSGYVKNGKGKRYLF
jgi:D-alanyl-D-alanine carboxypeptidase